MRSFPRIDRESSSPSHGVLRHFADARPREIKLEDSEIKPLVYEGHTRRPVKRAYATMSEKFFKLMSCFQLRFTTDILATQPVPVPPPQPQILHNHLMFTVSHQEPPLQPPASDTEILMRLTSWVQPGLYEKEFSELMGRLVQCSCGIIAARDVFNEHRCTLNMVRPMKRARLN